MPVIKSGANKDVFISNGTLTRNSSTFPPTPTPTTRRGESLTTVILSWLFLKVVECIPHKWQSYNKCEKV